MDDFTFCAVSVVSNFAFTWFIHDMAGGGNLNCFALSAFEGISTG